MKNFPIHKYVWELETYDDGTIRRKLATFAGFIGSGVKDKHGREIFEGDIILLDGKKFVATLDEGSFIIKNNNGEFYYLEPLLGEIVGHIAEEQP